MLVRLLDLTSLNNDDTESRIEKLCAKAQTPYGNVAAVCIYPKFLPLAKSLLDGTSVKLATVVNFPDGGSDLSKVRAETEYALEKGAVEIDAVFPYRNFLAGDYQTCADFVALISKITGKKHPSKIILETGVIEKAALISRAAGICIDNGANFIKTSTGKTPVSATPEAANVILETDNMEAAKHVAARANAVMLIPHVYVVNSMELKYRVQCHPIKNNDYERHFFFCYRKGMYLTRYMEDFGRIVCDKLNVPFNMPGHEA